MPRNLIVRPVGSGLFDPDLADPPPSNVDETTAEGVGMDVSVSDTLVGESLYPNEPAGFTTWFEHDWQTFPADEDIDMQASGTGWFKGVGTNSQINTGTGLIDDAGAPHGKGKTLRVWFPETQPGGTAPFSLALRSTDGTSHTSLQKWYVSYWLKPVASPIDGLWQMWTNQIRQFTINRQLHGTPSMWGWTFRNGHTTDPDDEFQSYRLWGRDDPAGSTVSHAESTPGPTVGQWHHIEILMDRTVKSAPLFASGADGLGEMDVTIWVDEVAIIDQVFTDFYAEHPFEELFFNFNGSGPDDKAREDWMDVGDMYISGEVMP